MRPKVKLCAPPTLSFKPIQKVEGMDLTDFSRCQSRMARLQPKLGGRRKEGCVGGSPPCRVRGAETSHSRAGSGGRPWWRRWTHSRRGSRSQLSEFLVLGSPSSDESCMVNRVIMETLDGCANRFSLLIPIARVVRWSSGETDLSNHSQELI